MHRKVKVWILLLVGTVFCSAGTLRAQDQPADAGAVAQAPDAAEEASPLLEEPGSPEAVFDAVVLMHDLERPNLARRYLQKLMDADPDDATVLKLRDKHGPAVFLELANEKRLQPLSTRLLDRMNAAFRRYAIDPSRVDALITDLTGSAAKREIATISLRATGPVAIPRMLTAIAQSSTAKKRDTILYAITRMGKQVVPPLLGALNAPDDGVRSVAIDALGWLGDHTVVTSLWYPAFSPDQPIGVQESARRALARIMRGDSRRISEVSAYGAVSQLRKAAQTHFRFEHPWALDDDGLTEFWSWDQTAGVLSSWLVQPDTASLIAGSRLARQALELGPDNRDSQALYLAMQLSFEAHVAGWDRSIPTGPGTAHDLALLAGADIAADVLDQSMKNMNPAGTLAALQVLSQVGNRSQLVSRAGRTSPILRALNYPNFRVQFAAASTVLQLDPERSFRGATRVVSILTRALADSGSRVALAIDPNEDRAATMAALFGEMGYDPQVANTGREGFTIAAERGDIDVIGIHAACIQWGLTQTIANLRADARTAGIPIVIYGPESVEADAQRLIDEYPLVGFSLNGEKSFKMGIRSFLSRLETPPVTDTQRAARIEAAGFWFAHIAGGRRTQVYNITPGEAALFQAVSYEEVGQNAVIALAAIPTISAQERLQEIAISEAHDPQIRESSALQLAFHIQKYGVLIKKDRVLEVTNQQATESDPNVKTALGSVVGSFRPERSRVINLLKSLPSAEIPAAE